MNVSVTKLIFATIVGTVVLQCLSNFKFMS